MFSKNKVNVTTNDERYYYWFALNKIQCTQNGYDGKLLNGKYTIFFLNNSLKTQGRFKKGLKHKEWKYWTKTGVLNRSENYCKGKLYGWQSVYDSLGIPIFRTYFKQNIITGIKYIYKDGLPNIAMRYKKGTLKETIQINKPTQRYRHWWCYFKWKNKVKIKSVTNDSKNIKTPTTLIDTKSKNDKPTNGKK